jgi:hypothetical protein
MMGPVSRTSLSSPRLDLAGAVLRLLVLAERPNEYLAVDVDSGAFVRAHGRTDADTGPRHILDVIKVELADNEHASDLSQPEAVTMAGPARPARRVRRGRVKRYLRALVAPKGEPLLGFPASAAPYWTLNGTRPSLALIAPDDGVLVTKRQPDETLWARFHWDGSQHHLPVDDARLSEAFADKERIRLSGRALAHALGHRPHYLLVALAPPRNGHCYKTLVAVLPRQ